MGLISGIVTYRDGQPSTLSQVSAALRGCGGRATSPVRTDDRGFFVLRWEGDCDAEIIYCDDRVVARNVSNGTTALHIVIGSGR